MQHPQPQVNGRGLIFKMPPINATSTNTEQQQKTTTDTKDNQELNNENKNENQSLDSITVEPLDIPNIPDVNIMNVEVNDKGEMVYSFVVAPAIIPEPGSLQNLQNNVTINEPIVSQSETIITRL